MSRTIVSLFALGFLSGCLGFPGRVSTTPVRLQTINYCNSCNTQSANSCDSCNGGCCDCIPHRPLGCWYHFDSYHYGIDCHITKMTAWHCGHQALRAYRRQFGRVGSCHFRRGFLQAYEDLAMNRRPSPPVIPPPLYWNAFYRSCAGKPDVEEWFAGYEAGLEWGSNSGVSQFHEIYLNYSGTGVGLGNRPAYGQGFRQAGYQPQASYAPPAANPDPNLYNYPAQQNLNYPAQQNVYPGQ